MGPYRPGFPSTHRKEESMKGLPTVLFCVVLGAALVACGQDKGKAPTAKKATTHAQKATNVQKKAQKKEQKKAPTLAQKKQQDRLGECNKQASLKNMKGENRKRFMSSCLSA
jgi:uncharacterized protein HemX